MNYQIKQLHSQAWALWKEIRLEALKLHPEAFTSSYEEEALWEDEKFKQQLEKSYVFAAFMDHKLVGVSGFFVLEPQKIKHRGLLFGVYIRKEHRGKGVAKQLLKEIINHARQKVVQLHCTVNAKNKDAFKLYQNHGFQLYGTAPRSLKIGDKFYDEHLMVLKFM